jgi:hypothetical protein
MTHSGHLGSIHDAVGMAVGTMLVMTVLVMVALRSEA